MNAFLLVLSLTCSAGPAQASDPAVVPTPPSQSWVDGQGADAQSRRGLFGGLLSLFRRKAQGGSCSCGANATSGAAVPAAGQPVPVAEAAPFVQTPAASQMSEYRPLPVGSGEPPLAPQSLAPSGQ